MTNVIDPTYSNCKKYLKLTTQKWPWNDNGNAISSEAWGLLFPIQQQYSFILNKCERLPTSSFYITDCKNTTEQLYLPQIRLLDELIYLFDNNADTCHKVIGDQIGVFLDNNLTPHSSTWDMSTLDHDTQKALAGAAEELGWH
jgi:hypothetical protein